MPLSNISYMSNTSSTSSSSSSSPSSFLSSSSSQNLFNGSLVKNLQKKNFDLKKTNIYFHFICDITSPCYIQSLLYNNDKFNKFFSLNDLLNMTYSDKFFYILNNLSIKSKTKKWINFINDFKFFLNKKIYCNNDQGLYINNNLFFKNNLKNRFSDLLINILNLLKNDNNNNIDNLNDNINIKIKNYYDLIYNINNKNLKQEEKEKEKKISKNDNNNYYFNVIDKIETWEFQFNDLLLNEFNFFFKLNKNKKNLNNISTCEGIKLIRMSNISFFYNNINNNKGSLFLYCLYNDNNNNKKYENENINNCDKLFKNVNDEIIEETIITYFLTIRGIKNNNNNKSYINKYSSLLFSSSLSSSSSSSSSSSLINKNVFYNEFIIRVHWLKNITNGKSLIFYVYSNLSENNKNILFCDNDDDDNNNDHNNNNFNNIKNENIKINWFLKNSFNDISNDFLDENKILWLFGSSLDEIIKFILKTFHDDDDNE